MDHRLVSLIGAFHHAETQVGDAGLPVQVFALAGFGKYHLIEVEEASFIEQFPNRPSPSTGKRLRR